MWYIAYYQPQPQGAGWDLPNKPARSKSTSDADMAWLNAGGLVVFGETTR
jgi:hypothetical protein